VTTKVTTEVTNEVATATAAVPSRARYTLEIVNSTGGSTDYEAGITRSRLGTWCRGFFFSFSFFYLFIAAEASRG
jgi:hypothetical protein